MSMGRISVLVFAAWVVAAVILVFSGVFDSLLVPAARPADVAEWRALTDAVRAIAARDGVGRDGPVWLLVVTPRGLTSIALRYGEVAEQPVASASCILVSMEGVNE